MTYSKPAGVSYTQMAIYIDQNIYSDKKDEEKLYTYLYHLAIMLATQGAYFSCAEEYDQFGLFSATRLYLRYTNQKQFETNDDGSPKMKKIKSCLNYIKRVIYPYKVDFDMEFNIENKNVDVIQLGGFDLGEHMIDQTSLFDSMSYSFTLGEISSIVRAHLKKIPYKTRSAEWMNIYTSCMLTLLNSMTLSNYQLKEFRKLKLPKYETLERLYTQLRYEDPILFHLDPSMSTYIRVLVAELRHVIAAELSWKGDFHISADESMKNLICNSMELEDN
jgi:hypothetical protein